jgi:hypothetical protein
MSGEQLAMSDQQSAIGNELEWQAETQGLLVAH